MQISTTLFYCTSDFDLNHTVDIFENQRSLHWEKLHMMYSKYCHCLPIFLIFLIFNRYIVLEFKVFNWYLWVWRHYIYERGEVFYFQSHPSCLIHKTVTNVSVNMYQKRGIVVEATKRRNYHLPCTSATLASWAMRKYGLKALPNQSKNTRILQSTPSACPSIGHKRDEKFRERTRNHEKL